MGEQIHLQIERFLRNELSREELYDFEEQLLNNPDLRKEVNEYREVFQAFEHFKEKNFVNKQLELISNQDSRNADYVNKQFPLYLKKYWRTATVAATVAIISSLGTFLIADYSYAKKERTKQLGLVTEDLQEIIKEQEALKEDIEKVQTNDVPDYPSKNRGTAFALSNSGYAITNLHVLKGNKIFIFLNNGKVYKCDVVHKDKKQDIAILKVPIDDFKFSDKPIPYALKAQTRLSENVYSIGYPKDEVVYNRGYVSSMNGRKGDSTKYQLELPSSPGMSGSPVLNAQGDVIGIVNSKVSVSQGITYAIKSEVVQNILEEMPDEHFNSNDISQNSFSNKNAADQIDALSDFVFVVKAWK